MPTVELGNHRPPLDVIDVPNGQHGFDLHDPTEESCAAVRQATAWVARALGRP